MLKIFVALLLTLSSAAIVHAQDPWSGQSDQICHFVDAGKSTSKLYTFPPDEKFVSYVNDITSTLGLAPNFELRQANVENAAALTHEGKRYIFYSSDFMNTLRYSDGSDLSKWVILAHEIGHHLNGHALDGSGSRPSKELEADLFAGSMVKRLGGSLENGLRVYRSMPEQDSATHPGNQARIEAFIKGFNSVETEFKNTAPVNLPPGDRYHDMIITPDYRVFSASSGNQVGSFDANGDAYDLGGNLVSRGAFTEYLLNKARDRMALDILNGMGETKVNVDPPEYRWVNEGHCQNGICYKKKD